MKNIVVVGGGSAGWLTALYARKSYPEENIVLIESDDIGILGAGEGSTPSIINVLNFLEIPIYELIKECNVTIKNSIKFTNWSSSKKYYHHGFSSSHPASNDYNFYFSHMDETDIPFSHIYASCFDHELKDYSLSLKISEQNKVPFLSPTDFNFNNFANQSISDFSIHFDAKLFVKYLRKVGESRGITRKEGVVNNILSDEDGYINILQTDKENILCDFVFDCTGFKRLIIGNFYKSQWDSYSKILPANKALPFFLPMEKNIPPYTEAIAMKYGWMWKIPLQDRYGCGYVFDDNFISVDDAKKEIEDFIGNDINSTKTFNFNPGCYKEIWIKNCIAIGLSASFIEPLEATSIWQFSNVLQNFFSLYNSINIKNQKTIDRFNKKYLLETECVVNFLYLHYITDKKETDFWKNFLKNTETPEQINYILSIIKERPIQDEIDFTIPRKMFPVASYYYIMVGNNLLDKNLLNSYTKFMKNNKEIDYLKILKEQDYIIPNLISHNQLLSEAKNF